MGTVNNPSRTLSAIGRQRALNVMLNSFQHLNNRPSR